jgi:hypothetical protein
MTEPDVLEFGGSPRGRPPWHVRLRWLGLPLVLAVAAVVALVAHASRPATPAAAPSSTPAAASPPQPTLSPSPSPEVAVTQAGRALLGVTANWELFAWGPDGLMRIQLAQGRVTQTAVPALSSSGPVSFLVGLDWAMLRPMDVVPGYLVRDGHPTEELAGMLRLTGPALPGPDPNHLWIPSGTGEHAEMVLVDTAGRRTGPAIAIPVTMNNYAESDGGGYPLLHGPGGVYDARPGGLRRITTGTVLATGPTGWLALECDELFRCGTVLIDRGTGARHPARAPALQAYLTGLISPDGAFAAIAANNPGDSVNPVSVHLIRLSSGADRQLDVPVGPDIFDGNMVWSPDGRWLFVVQGGTLRVVDAASGKVGDLGVPLPQVTQLAIRNAPP